MKKIYKQELITKAIDNCIYRDLLLSLEIPLFLVEYEPGENISSPINDFQYFQIVLCGNLSIYFIRDDGSQYSLSSGGKNSIIGELELFSITQNNVFAEATERLVSVAIDAKRYRNSLLNNIDFMQLVASAMAEKIEFITTMNAKPLSLSDRVINYMKYKCDNKTLKGIEKAAFYLHCSSRQLQRILNNFEKDGLVQKIGKGTYRLQE